MSKTIVRSVLWSGVLSLLIAGAVAAQEKPDFSGEWVLVKASGVAFETPSALSVRQIANRTGVPGTPIDPVVATVRIERHYTSGTRVENYQVGILGGIAGGVGRSGSGAGANGESPRTRYATTWDEDRL